MELSDKTVDRGEGVAGVKEGVPTGVVLPSPQQQLWARKLSPMEELAQWQLMPAPTRSSTKRRLEERSNQRLQPIPTAPSASSSSLATPSSPSTSEQPAFRSAISNNAWSDSLHIGLGPTRPKPSSIASYRRKLGIPGPASSTYPLYGQVVSPASEGSSDHHRPSIRNLSGPSSAPESRRILTPPSSYFPPSSGFDSPPQIAQHQPIRLRRVGALGISVSDSSSSRDDGGSSSHSRRRRRSGPVHSGWSNEDRRKSAQDKAEWGGEELGGELDSAGVYANGRQGGISEAGFRGIVDELAMQSELSLTSPSFWRRDSSFLTVLVFVSFRSNAEETPAPLRGDESSCRVAEGPVV